MCCWHCCRSLNKHVILTSLVAPSTHEAHTLHARDFRHAEFELNNPDACSKIMKLIADIFVVYNFIEFGSPSGAASNLGLTIVTFADFSDYYGGG